LAEKAEGDEVDGRAAPWRTRGAGGGRRNPDDGVEAEGPVLPPADGAEYVHLQGLQGQLAVGDQTAGGAVSLEPPGDQLVQGMLTVERGG